MVKYDSQIYPAATDDGEHHKEAQMHLTYLTSDIY